MTIRHALSTIRATHWADAKPLLRIRVTNAQTAKRGAPEPSSRPLPQRPLGQGLVVKAMMIVADNDGEATVSNQESLAADWDVGPDDIWEAAVSNTRRAVALSQQEPVARLMHQGWHLTFLTGRNRVAANADWAVDRPPATTLWWSALSAQAMVILRPGDQPSKSRAEEASRLVADLAAITDHPLPLNLFTVTEVGQR